MTMSHRLQYNVISKLCACWVEMNHNVSWDPVHYLWILSQVYPGPEVIKLFPCSTQLSIKIFLLINIKMSINVGILTFDSRKISILGLSEPEKYQISCDNFIFMSI